MRVTKETYAPEQRENADLACKTLTSLPEDQQRIAAMMANVYLDGWMARDLLAASSYAVQPTPAGGQQPHTGA